MARPCKLDTVQFRRKLSDAHRQILLAAGAGDLTRGFDFVLELYVHAHALGFRPNQPLDFVHIVTNENDSH